MTCPGCGVLMSKSPLSFGQPGLVWNCFNPDCHHVGQIPIKEPSA